MYAAAHEAITGMHTCSQLIIIIMARSVNPVTKYLVRVHKRTNYVKHKWSPGPFVLS